MYTEERLRKVIDQFVASERLVTDNPVLDEAWQALEDASGRLTRLLIHLERSVISTVAASPEPAAKKARRVAGFRARIDAIEGIGDEMLEAAATINGFLSGRVIRAPAATRRDQAKLAAQAKLARDPKQRAKVEAFAIWQQWDRTRFRTQAALAAHICEVTALTSVKHVESLITQWERTQRTR